MPGGKKVWMLEGYEVYNPLCLQTSRLPSLPAFKTDKEQTIKKCIRRLKKLLSFF